MRTLEDSLGLYPVGEGAWRAQGDPAYEAGTGMFGGWTAALLMKAVLADERAEGEPATLNVNYVSRVDPTSALTLSVTPLGGSRSVATWQVELRNEDREGVAALATVVMASRRESIAFTEFTKPEAPDPQALDIFHPPAPFGQQTDMRPVTGFPPLNRPDTRSTHWVRDMTGGPLDHPRLAYLSDSYAPRILFKGSSFRPSSTLTMSVYFYATAQELADVGDGHVLGEVVGTRAESSICGSQLRLWSPAGALLATSEQMCWFK